MGFKTGEIASTRRNGMSDSRFAQKTSFENKPEKGYDKDKALESAMSQIEKQFGKGAVMRLGDSKHLQVEVIPTGSLSLDLALGVCGLPRGRIIEIFGPESSGKTTLTLQIVAEAQKMFKLPVFEISTFTPSIRSNFPKTAAKPKIFWVGR